jgi:hypothetical protein
MAASRMDRVEYFFAVMTVTGFAVLLGAILRT